MNVLKSNPLQVLLISILMGASLQAGARSVASSAHQRSSQNASTQISELAEAAGGLQICENVDLYINCFGQNACEEANRQKIEAALPFRSLGLNVYALKNYWKMGVREYKGELVLRPQDLKTIKLRAVQPRISYYGDQSGMKCVSKLFHALSTSAQLGPKAHRAKLTLRTTRRLPNRQKSAIVYEWANPEQL